jgi:Na+/melibiose symporter-like transporter
LVRGKKRKKAFGWLAPYLCVCVCGVSLSHWARNHIRTIVKEKPPLHTTQRSGEKKISSEKSTNKKTRNKYFFFVCVLAYLTMWKKEKKISL